MVERLRVCLVYDCLFPHTVGGAERWYRNVGERLAAEGHDVTYLTLRQWPRGTDPGVPGVHVVAVGPRIGLYTASGRRRIGPPLVFGFGVLAHLARRGGRYDVVHTASFPYFGLLAAGAPPRGRAPRAPGGRAAGGGRAAARAALSARGRLARGVDARLLARLPRARGRLGRVARPDGVRAHPAARVLLLAPARGALAPRGPPGFGHRARGAVLHARP